MRNKGDAENKRDALVIRNYRSDDEKDFFELIRLTYGEELIEIKTRQKEWLYKKNPYLSTNPGQALVAEIDGRVAAVVKTMPVGLRVGDKVYDHEWVVDYMSHPQVRGKGMGLKILMRIIAGGKEMVGATPVWGSMSQIHHKKHIDRSGVGTGFQIGPTSMLAAVVDLSFLSRKVTSRNIVHDLVSTASRPLVKTAFRRKRPSSVSRSDFFEIERFDDDVLPLFESVAQRIPVITRRDSAYPNWRYVDRPDQHYSSFGYRKGGSLAGYIVVRHAEIEGARRGYVADLLADPKDESVLPALLSRAFAYFEENRCSVAFTLESFQPSLMRAYKRFGFLKWKNLPAHSLLLQANRPDVPLDLIREITNWDLTLDICDLEM